MNQRTVHIVQKLSHTSDRCSLSSLADAFGVSERTIRNDIKSLNKFLSQEGIGNITFGSKGVIVLPAGFSRAEELLGFMGLGERMNHKPNELSGGEKQRVAVARALMNNPAVVFADEPSGSLDSKNKQELHQLFFDLRDKFGQTFVIVTHDEELARLTDRTIQMRDGLIIQPAQTEIITPEAENNDKNEQVND